MQVNGAFHSIKESRVIINYWIEVLFEQARLYFPELCVLFQQSEPFSTCWLCDTYRYLAAHLPAHILNRLWEVSETVSQSKKPFDWVSERDSLLPQLGRNTVCSSMF